MKKVAKERTVDREDSKKVKTAISKVATRDSTEPSYLDFQANPHIRGVIQVRRAEEEGPWIPLPSCIGQSWLHEER